VNLHIVTHFGYFTSTYLTAVLGDSLANLSILSAVK